MTRVSNPFKSNPFRSRRGASSPLLFAAFVLLVLYMAGRSIFVKKEEMDVAVTGESIQQTQAQASFVSGGITVHREKIDDRDVLWASPQDNQKGDIKGLLFLAHGCGHSNLDWFSKNSERCEDCRGLPEESSIVQTALDLGLVAIATSSSNWRSKCWSGFDTTPTALVLNELWHRFSQAEELQTTNSTTLSRSETNQTNVPRLPIYAFGASSGGSFVSTLASPLQSRFGIRLDGFVSQIAAKPTNARKDEKEPQNLCKVYISMIKDAKTDSAAKDQVEKCQSSKRKHKCKHIRLPPLPIPPNYFSDRIQEVSEFESFDIVKVLTRGGFIRPDNGTLYQDPRTSHTNWSRALQQATHEKQFSALEFSKRGDALAADQSPIFEVLNVAWGNHELSRDGVREALEFCLEQDPTEAKK